MTNNHGGARSNTGPKSKASQGLKRHKQLSITLPHDLWLSIDAKRHAGESTSALLARLLNYAKEEE